jgi:exosortase
MKRHAFAPETPMSTALEVLETSTREPNWVVWSIVSAGLTILLYSHVLKALVLDWWTNPDYGHGFFVPLFSGYVLWRQRDSWMRTQIKPSNVGLLVILGAVGLLLAGSLGAELFTTRFSLLVLLAGMIIFLAGWEVLHVGSFALGFLIFMIPIPQVIYNQITFPLQLVASRLAAFLLELIRVPVLRDGNILIMSNYSLEVAEACSGIRFLITLVALAVAFGYFAESRHAVRYVLAILMVPNAIVCNAIRIVGAGMLAHRFGPRAAAGFSHAFSGWVVFLLALALMVSCWRVLELIGHRHKEGVHA